jgi:hypothetical protein
VFVQPRELALAQAGQLAGQAREKIAQVADERASEVPQDADGVQERFARLGDGVQLVPTECVPRARRCVSRWPPFEVVVENAEFVPAQFGNPLGEG